MGIRFEKGRKKVSENKSTFEKLDEQKSILGREYSPLSAIEALQKLLDEEASETIDNVKAVGDFEAQRIESEITEAEKEKTQISGELSSEIAKLNTGLEKLKAADGIAFGKKAVEKSSQDYKKQIDKFKALKEELLGAANEGTPGAVEHVISTNMDIIESLYEPLENSGEVNTLLDVSGKSNAVTEFVKQTEHRPLVSSHEDAVNAVVEDVRLGSGQELTREQAETLLSGIRVFSGEEYSLIRKAYNNPNAPQSDIASLNALDTYIRSAPKWDGEIYRGINVSRNTANAILSQQTVDMQGPSSWSSELNVAERFSVMGNKSIHMVFVLPENRSGASITHLATYNGAESEVTAPSGIQYTIDRYEKARVDNRDYIYVYVHE